MVSGSILSSAKLYLEQNKLPAKYYKLVNPLFLDYPGLRVDNLGQIIPHSILGSIDDFIEQAVINGDHSVS